jgi:hypothetical protein
MKKILVIFLILFLISSTAFIKNSTKRIDDEIFIVEENIRILRKNFENIKLENNYLGSANRLLKFQNLYFDNELIKQEIQDLKIIHKTENNLKIDQLKFINE